MLAESERRIADLSRQLEEAKRKSAVGSSAPAAAPSAEPTRDFSQLLAETRGKGLALIKQRDTEQLLAAGFSMERIEWIRRRTDELQVDFERRVHDGDRGNPALLPYIVDPDLDLRQEMGEEEYDRYRTALGRPLGVLIERVLPTSSAEDAGLKAGDQVLGYAGKRVYNEPMLSALIASDDSGGPVMLDVLREGVKTRVVVPAGPLGVRVDVFLPAVRAKATAMYSAGP